MEWEFDAQGPVDADIEVAAGRIEVAPAAPGKIAVRLQPLGGRRAEELVAASDVSFAEGRLRVRVPERRGRAAEVACTVTIPDSSSLATRTASADVHCPVRLGRYSGTTASGDMVLGDVEADVSAKSASGDLRCETVGGELQARTASGDVSARRVGGDTKVATASGDVELDDAGASVKVETASGDVTVGRAATGRVQVSSASGDVAIGVAAGVGAYLDVSTVTGDTTTTLPFAEPAPGTTALEIVCRTVTGDVAVRGAAS